MCERCEHSISSEMKQFYTARLDCIVLTVNFEENSFFVRLFDIRSSPMLRFRTRSSKSLLKDELDIFPSCQTKLKLDVFFSKEIVGRF